MHTAPWLSPLWNSVSEDREGDGAGPTPTREGDGGREGKGGGNVSLPGVVRAAGWLTLGFTFWSADR